MMRAINKLIDPIKRQIRNAIARGILTLIDDTTGLQRVQVQLMAFPQPDGSMGSEVNSDIEVMAHYAFTSVPFPSAECAYVAVGGVRAHGLVIATDDRRYRPTGLATGESMHYDDQGQQIYISRTGIVIKGAGLPVIVTDTPSVTLDTAKTVCTGTLTVEGLITGEGGIGVTGNSGTGATANITGNIVVTDGDVTVDGIAVKGHGHIDEGIGSRTSNSVE
jgi:phage baseplate assembly protein V